MAMRSFGLSRLNKPDPKTLHKRRRVWGSISCGSLLGWFISVSWLFVGMWSYFFYKSSWLIHICILTVCSPVFSPPWHPWIFIYFFAFFFDREYYFIFILFIALPVSSFHYFQKFYLWKIYCIISSWLLHDGKRRI